MTLHAPASRRAGNSERVATYVQIFEDAPRASTRVATYAQNFKDAPRASLTTCRKHLRPEFRGHFTRQRHDARNKTRGSPLTPRISRTLHAPASRRAGNSEKVASYGWNLEDAPHSSVTMRRTQREGRHLRTEFQGRFNRQRDATL